MTGLRVTSAPLFDVDAGRREIELPTGLTVAEIVYRALPGLPI